MSKKSLAPETLLYPVPVVMVSCGNRKGDHNIITIAWVGTLCSEPPMVGISVRPERYSYDMIKESNEFVVNIPSHDQLKATDHCGIVSGRDQDKYKSAGLNKKEALSLKAAPIIEDCPVNIECIVKNTVPLGSHDLFIGEITAVQADEEIITAKGAIDVKKANPLAYGAGEYWLLDQSVLKHGESKISK